MKLLKKAQNYFFYCGIERDEYNALKKDAYVSNFEVWRVLHFLMAGMFAIMFIGSFYSPLLSENRILYLAGLIYSVAGIFLFFSLEKDSLIAQFIIYLSISFLFLFGCIITSNRPEVPAVTFIAFLMITPMFMIDKPFFMAIELVAASSVFLIWMYGVKPYEVWQIDFANVAAFTLIGIFLNIIANSVRIKEFVLTREIKKQKDTDDLTGLKNKGALTREINSFLLDPSKDKGIMFLLDIDLFKLINDTYGHDVGDSVIQQLGVFFGRRFKGNEIAGRFGGDEFIIFVKDTDEEDVARRIAEEIITGAAKNIEMLEGRCGISVSIGIAIYNGSEKNYSEIFKKVDTALYASKDDPKNRYHIYGA